MIMIVLLCGFTNLIVRIVLKVVVVQMLVSDINNLECQDMMMIIILMVMMMMKIIMRVYVKIYDNNHHKVWRARQPSHRSRARYAQNRGG